MNKSTDALPVYPIEKPTYCGVPISKMDVKELRAALSYAAAQIERLRAMHAHETQQLLAINRPANESHKLVVFAIGIILGMVLGASVPAFIRSFLGGCP